MFSGKTKRKKHFFDGLSHILLLITFFFIVTIVPAAKPFKLYGIYLNSWVMNSSKNFQQLLLQSKKYGINTFVCDYLGEKNSIYLNNLQLAKKNGIYCIARIVVFQDGATAETIKDKTNWSQKLQLAQKAEKIGYDEIQFDYIRFADVGKPNSQKKYIIGDFIKEAGNKIHIPIQADVFGSVAYHPHNIIGQDLGYFSNLLSAACPMLYPSHFFLDKMRMSRPYFTMREGCTLAKKQIGSRPMRLIPYIQGFDLNLHYSKMELSDYIVAQIRAAEDAKTNGFFVWHAGSDYRATWQALTKYPIK